MTILEILKSVFLGMALAAPVGPISLLCMRTTLSSGFASGLSAGLGAAAADGLVCLAALGGVAAIVSTSMISTSILSYGAAAFLVYLGAKMLLKSNESLISPDRVKSSVKMSFFYTFSVTVINPLTLMSFGALFCGSAAQHKSISVVTITAAAVALGSALWWLILAAFLSVARQSLGPRAMKSINIASAICILACGVKLFFP